LKEKTFRYGEIFYGSLINIKLFPTVLVDHARSWEKPMNHCWFGFRWSSAMGCTLSPKIGLHRHKSLSRGFTQGPQWDRSIITEEKTPHCVTSSKLNWSSWWGNRWTRSSGVRKFGSSAND